MFARIDMRTVKVRDPIYVRRGRGTNHVFASGTISEIDQESCRVKVLIDKVLLQFHKAVNLGRKCSVNANEVYFLPDNAELNIEAPFSLIGTDFNCILTAKGITCVQSGNRLKFTDARTICAWTNSVGLVIHQGEKNVFLNGKSDSILFVLNGADIVEWHNKVLMEN